jgi:hypothetical protein
MKLAPVFPLGVSVVLSVRCLTACASDQPALGSADAGSSGSPSRASGGTGGAAGSASGGGGRVSSGGAGGREDAGVPDSDGEAPVAYDCIGGKVARAKVDSGSDAEPFPIDRVVVPWTTSVGTCEAGATYCFIKSRQYTLDALPVLTCEAVPAACTATPNCACFCSHGLLSCQYVNCSCKDDANGRAIVTCDQI